MSAEPEAAASPPRTRGNWLFWVFAVIGALAVVGFIVIVAIMMRWEMAGPHREPARVAEGKAAEANYSVLDVRPVRGTGLVAIKIGISGGDSGSSPYSGTVDEIRNIVLLDSASGANRRLLDGNTREVIAFDYFSATAGYGIEGIDDIKTDAGTDENKPPFAFYALTVEQAGSKKRDLLVGDLASGKQGFVLKGIDGVDRWWMLDATRLAVLMRQDLKLHYRVIDLTTLQVVASRAVEIG